MLAQLIVLFVFPILLALAAGWDLASYTIPNTIPAGVLLVFALYAFATGMPFPALAMHLGIGLAGLALGFALFAFGAVGGGDAKFFACVALMFGLPDMLDYTIVAMLFGGALTLALLALRQMPLPAPLAAQSWISRLHDANSGVPYGVALAAGAFFVLPHSEIFRAAALG
jgi:prepilin peptidase CpaA